MKKMSLYLLTVAMLSLSSFAQAEDKTMCGAYGHDDESFTGPEKNWLEVNGNGTVTLQFDGQTPMMNDSQDYCCFGDYNSSRKVLHIKTGCDEQ